MFKRGRTDSKADDAGLSRLFMIALRTGSSAAVRAFLSRKTELSATDGRGRSPLIIAATLGHLAICKLLLEAGSDPLVRDMEGFDASHHARQAGHDEILDLLELAKGIRPEEPGHSDPESGVATTVLPGVRANRPANHLSLAASTRLSEFPSITAADTRAVEVRTQLRALVAEHPEQRFDANESQGPSASSIHVELTPGERDVQAEVLTKSPNRISAEYFPVTTQGGQYQDSIISVPEPSDPGACIDHMSPVGAGVRPSARGEHHDQDAETVCSHEPSPETDCVVPPLAVLGDVPEIERTSVSEMRSASSISNPTGTDSDGRGDGVGPRTNPPTDEEIDLSWQSLAEFEVDGAGEWEQAVSSDGASAETLPGGQIVSGAMEEISPPSVMPPSSPSPRTELDVESWEVDTSQLPVDNDRSAVQAASLVQERLSNAIRLVGGEDWSSIEIDLPEARSGRSERILPKWILATASDALIRASAIGEFQDDHCELPRRLLDIQEHILRRAVRRAAAALGCVVDRIPDPWSDALSRPPGGSERLEEIDDALDAVATHFWSVGRPSSYDALLDAMPRLERTTETDLFRQIARSTAEAMLSIAKSAAAIDFILSADDLVEEARLPFTFLSSHPMNDDIEDGEARSGSGEDEDVPEADDTRDAMAMIELPAAYVSAILQLRTIRESRSAIMLPSEIRRAAQALQGLALTTEFLGYLACELPAIDGSQETMNAVFGAMRRADQARQMVLERHLPQARAFAQRYLGRGLELDDLVQEANIGLMRAIETFDTARGHRFWTYAQAWVWQRLNRSIADLGSAIRLPVHVLQDRRRLEVVIEEREKSGDRCDAQSLAQSCDLPIKAVQRLLGAWTVDALEEAEDLADDGVAGARLVDDSRADPLANSLENDLAEELGTELEELPPRIAEVIRMRFGLEGRQEHTLEEIGHQYGVTRERIRQLEAKGLKILAHPARSRALRTFLEH